MANRSPQNEAKDQEYLSKEILKRAVRKGIKEASEQALETAGSVVIAEGNWIVRSHSDGKVEKIRKLDRTSTRDIQRKIDKLASK
jgi:hypothetical protein